MKDMTTEKEREWAERSDRWFRVIYKTKDGLDYCRSDAPIDVETYDDAVKWAKRQYMDAYARAVVVGFVIERW